MRGSASSTPKVPWESVTGSETPRASHRVSASRSNVKAQAARAPCGQVRPVTLAGAGLGCRRTVPRDGEPEAEHAPVLAIPVGRAADRKVRRDPAGEADPTRSGRRLVLG